MSVKVNKGRNEQKGLMQYKNEKWILNFMGVLFHKIYMLHDQPVKKILYFHFSLILVHEYNIPIRSINL